MSPKRLLACLVFTALLVCGRAQEWDWVQRFQGDNSGGTSIALDGGGNIYVAGGFSGTNQIGTNQLISAGGSDIFIVKLNPTGGVVWAISAGGTNDDSIGRIIVATNGALFVYGHFEIPSSLLAASVTNANDTASNVFVARVDDGKFTWINSFPPEVGANGGAVAVAPDESIWMIGASNHVFLKHFRQDGTELGGLDVSENLFGIQGLAINRDGKFFAHGVVYGTQQLTSNVTVQGYFIAGIDNSGQIQWAQSAGSDGVHPFPVYQIACAPDGGIVSVGYQGILNFPADSGVVVKYTADGTLLWKRTRGAYFKYSFSLYGLTVDNRGTVRATGRGQEHYYGPEDRDKLWLLTLDANGQTLSEQFVKSVALRDRNTGLAIAANSDGQIFVTGQLMGTPLFGTNIMGDGPSGIANAFIARRATLEPTLDFRRSGTNMVLDWPRTSAPFALQQSDDLSTNAWLDVVLPPEVTDHGSQIALPMEAPSRAFRLRMTNEPPSCQPPHIFDPVQVNPGGSFLGRFRVFVTASNSVPSPVFSAYAATSFALNYDALTFQWFNPATGQPLTNGTSVTSYQIEDEQRIWIGTLHDDSLTFPIGTNTISVSAFDGPCEATDSVMIEVISVSTALDQLISRVQAATTNSEDLVAPLQTAKDDVNSGLFNDASAQLSEFQMRLADSSIVSDADKNQFQAAAQTLIDAISQEYR